jgi:hypothetical protein
MTVEHEARSKVSRTARMLDRIAYRLATRSDVRVPLAPAVRGVVDARITLWRMR